MDILNLVLFGAVVGAASNLLDPNTKKGFLGPVFLGILGSTIGGTLANLLFSFSDLTNSNLIVFALAAAVTAILVGISKLLKSKDNLNLDSQT